jgi:hypothetical protein
MQRQPLVWPRIELKKVVAQEGTHEAQKPGCESIALIVKPGFRRVPAPQLIQQIAAALYHEQMVLGLGRIDIEERLLDDLD